MIFLVVRRFDLVGIFDKAGLPLRRLACKKAVEIIEAMSGRPAIERTHRGGLIGGGVVPFADRRGLVTVIPQDLRHRGGALRNHAGVSVPIDRAFRDRAVADPLMIASGQQCSARRRADRSCMEGVVTDALVGELAQRRGIDLAAECRGLSETDIVHQDDQHIGRILAQMALFHAPHVLGILQPRRGDARRRRTRKRKDGPIGRSGVLGGLGKRRAHQDEERHSDDEGAFRDATEMAHRMSPSSQREGFMTAT